MAKKIILTALEKQIEQELERGEWKPVSAERTAEIVAMAKKAQAKRAAHGGVRAGSGRKRLGHVPTLLNLKQETRDYLRKSGGARGMGAVVDRLVKQQRSH